MADYKKRWGDFSRVSVAAGFQIERKGIHLVQYDVFDRNPPNHRLGYVAAGKHLLGHHLALDVGPKLCRAVVGRVAEDGLRDVANPKEL